MERVLKEYQTEWESDFQGAQIVVVHAPGLYYRVTVSEIMQDLHENSNLFVTVANYDAAGSYTSGFSTHFNNPNNALVTNMGNEMYYHVNSAETLQPHWNTIFSLWRVFQIPKCLDVTIAQYASELFYLWT